MDTTITFRISDEEKKELEKLAEKTGMTVSQLLRKGIKEIIKEENQEKPLQISEY